MFGVAHNGGGFVTYGIQTSALGAYQYCVSSTTLSTSTW
jgi:hypothetical protein